MKTTSIYDTCRFKCRCQPYGGGHVIHAWGVVMDNCLSWACLLCLQAHVSFFEVQNDRLVQVHDETFACIADLPECLQFGWIEWDEDGTPMYWDRELTDDHEEKIIKRRRQLDLPELDNGLYERSADVMARLGLSAQD